MTGHWEIRQTDAAEPWHAVWVGGNHEPVLTGENVATWEDAVTSIASVVRAHVGATSVDVRADGPDGEWRLAYDGQLSDVAVVHVDERAGVEPPC